MRVVEVTATPQPELPQREPPWPAATVGWWQMWKRSPLTAEFTENDWSELLDTALVHAAFWEGNLKAAAELRLRVANFGATPSDRARLRITFAAAEAAEVKTPKRAKPSAFSGLHVTA